MSLQRSNTISVHGGRKTITRHGKKGISKIDENDENDGNSERARARTRPVFECPMPELPSSWPRYANDHERRSESCPTGPRESDTLRNMHVRLPKKYHHKLPPLSALFTTKTIVRPTEDSPPDLMLMKYSLVHDVLTEEEEKELFMGIMKVWYSMAEEALRHDKRTSERTLPWGNAMARRRAMRAADAIALEKGRPLSFIEYMTAGKASAMDVGFLLARGDMSITKADLRVHQCRLFGQFSQFNGSSDEPSAHEFAAVISISPHEPHSTEAQNTPASEPPETTRRNSVSGPPPAPADRNSISKEFVWDEDYLEHWGSWKPVQQAEWLQEHRQVVQNMEGRYWSGKDPNEAEKRHPLRAAGPSNRHRRSDSGYAGATWIDDRKSLHDPWIMPPPENLPHRTFYFDARPGDIWRLIAKDTFKEWFQGQGLSNDELDAKAREFGVTFKALGHFCVILEKVPTREDRREFTIVTLTSDENDIPVAMCTSPTCLELKNFAKILPCLDDKKERLHCQTGPWESKIKKSITYYTRVYCEPFPNGNGGVEGRLIGYQPDIRMVEPRKEPKKRLTQVSLDHLRTFKTHRVVGNTPGRSGKSIDGYVLVRDEAER